MDYIYDYFPGFVLLLGGGVGDYDGTCPNGWWWVSTQKGSLSWIEIPLEWEEDKGKNLQFIFCEVQDAKSGEMRRW